MMHDPRQHSDESSSWWHDNGGIVLVVGAAVLTAWFALIMRWRTSRDEDAEPNGSTPFDEGLAVVVPLLGI